MPRKPTPDPAEVRFFHLGVAYVAQSPPSHQDHIRRGRVGRFDSTHNLPKQALRAVAVHGPAHLSARHHSETHDTGARRQYEGDEQRVHETLPALVHAIELSLLPQSRPSPLTLGLSPRHTAMRCRPFRRRRASTARPAFERIRTRKPCVRLLRRRFGWNVLFIVSHSKSVAFVPLSPTEWVFEAKPIILAFREIHVNRRPHPSAPLPPRFPSTALQFLLVPPRTLC
jgi:hypothetical protein